MILDGRLKEAKRYTVVVETTDLADFIKEDWTVFKKYNKLEKVYEAISVEVQKMFSKIAHESIEETTEQIKIQYNELSPLGKYEFNEAIQHISITNPTAKDESISLALETVLKLEKTRSRSELLQLAPLKFRVSA